MGILGEITSTNAGPAGPIGPIGVQGATGVQGPTGPARIINTLAGVNTGAYGATSTISYSPGNISKLGSGQMLVAGKACPIPSNAVAVSMNLYRDVTKLAPELKTEGDVAGQHEPGTLVWIDTAPDTSPHSYSIQATVATGTISDGVGHLVLAVTEL